MGRTLTRYDLVRRLYPAEQDRLEAKIAAGEALNFMPNKFTDRDETTWRRVRGTRERQNTYVLHVFGCLETGVKVCLDVGGILPSFDVLISDGGYADALVDITKIIYTAMQNSSNASQRDSSADSDNFTAEEIRAKPGSGYTEKQATYAHLEFRDTRTRRTALDALRNAEYETASDDKPSKRYYRKVLREYGLTGADWLKVENYRVTAPADGGERGIYANLAVDIRDIHAFADPLDEGQLAAAMKIKMRNPLLAKDKTLVMTWDLETEDLAQPGIVPTGESPTSSIFMFCATFHWIDSDEPLESICITYLDSEPGDYWTTVKCQDEADLIDAAMDMIHDLSPDIIVGFNDGAYDWPFLLAKCQKYDKEMTLYRKCSGLPIPDWSKLEYVRWDMLMKDRKIKIDADNSMFVTCLDVPGIICVDARIQMIQSIGPTPKQSLNYFLEYHHLPLKVDMPYSQMFRIVANNDAAGMKRVAEYCVVDAMSCQRLLLRRNVIREKREGACLSFISLDDAIFYAGGLRVCNILQTVAGRMGMKCRNIGKQEKLGGKYPGAWVFDPIKGIHRGRPITGLDFSSLYPSIIIAYNMSIETFVATSEEAEELIRAGRKLHHVKFNFGTRVDGTAPAVEGWFIRHENDPDKFGLYPKILKDMFDRRKEMKKQLGGYLTPLIEKMDKIIGEGVPVTEELLRAERIYDEMDDESGLSAEARFDSFYQEIAFKRSLLDAKQKAFKVLMNTFYGEAGNALSPFFLLELAGGVTSAGQYNIKLVSSYIQGRGYRIMYGDTDSVYVMCPDAVYAALDEEYGAGLATKLEYCSRMVTTTMADIAALRDDVNAMLAADNGTPFLNVAYEEVLFPTVLTGKKKYFGVPHINIPNFKPKKPFIKGIDVVKRNQCNFAKNMGMRVMWEALSMDRDDDMKSIVLETLQKALTDETDIKDFVLIDTYREHKKNIAVHNFVGRAKEAHERDLRENERRQREAAGGSPPDLLPLIHTPPDPGERFEYVVVARPDIDERGRKISLSKGDRMEYVEVAAKTGLQIDKGYYVESYLAGILARFIVVDDMFRRDTDREEIAAAKKFIITTVKEYMHRTKEDMAAKRKVVSSAFKARQKKYMDSAEAAGAGNVHRLISEDKTASDIFDAAEAMAEKIKLSPGYLEDIARRIKERLSATYSEMARALDPSARRNRTGKAKAAKFRRAAEIARATFVRDIEDAFGDLEAVRAGLAAAADAVDPYAEIVGGVGVSRAVARMEDSRAQYAVSLARLADFNNLMAVIRGRRDRERKHVAVVDSDEIARLIRTYGDLDEK